MQWWGDGAGNHKQYLVGGSRIPGILLPRSGEKLQRQQTPQGGGRGQRGRIHDATTSSRRHPTPSRATQRRSTTPKPLSGRIWPDSRARTVPPNLSESCQVTRPLRSRTVRLPGTPPCRTEPVRTVPSNPSSQSRSEYGVPVRRDPLRREAHGTGRPVEPRVAEHPRRRLLDTPQVTPNDT